MSDVVNNAEGHRFELKVGGETAFAEYSLVEGGMILPHTVVPEALEGQGLASQLAVAAMAYAREHDLKVIPTCTFMAGYMAKHPEHHDLVHPAYRERLGIKA